MRSSSSSLALAFVTIERPHAAQRLIRSVRKYFPDLPIYVADQSHQIDAISTFYVSNRVKVVRMPYDIGVAASRNELARQIKEDYFVLCDDDFIVGQQTRFLEAIHILDTILEIGVVGGRLLDFDGREEWIRNWELYLEYDARHKTLFSIPIYELAPKVREVGGVPFYLCDAVLNFALFRRSMFSTGVQWDERFKSNGEHEDFYLNLKLNTSFRVVHLPTMVAYHHHPEAWSAYRSRLRDRNEGWERFFEKWELEQYLELGLGVRTIDDVSTVTASADARSRFFVNADLSLRQVEPMGDALLVENFAKIWTGGGLDEWGNRAGEGTGMGRLLLDPEARTLIAAPDAKFADRTPDSGGPASERDLSERYCLEASEHGRVLSFGNEEVYYRYDAILRADRDFFLWYCCKGLQSEFDCSERRLPVVFRWSACDGTPLVWRTGRRFLDLQSTGCWRPLLLELPVPPRGSRWLRFDVLTDDGHNSQPIGTGFLFGDPYGRIESGQAFDDAGFEVLGLSQIRNDGGRFDNRGRCLEEIGPTCAKLSVTVHACALAADISFLRVEEIPGIEELFFVGWDSLGRSLVCARLPAAVPAVPVALALPKAGWYSPDSRLYGFGRTVGFVTLSAR